MWAFLMHLLNKRKSMEIERIIDIIKEVYIGVYGLEKWHRLSDTEKHDVTMIMVKDMLTMIDKI